MTIDEAIKKLTDYKEGCFYDDSPALDASLQLGIEALEAIKQLKEWGIIFDTHKLPGETEK